MDNMMAIPAELAVQTEPVIIIAGISYPGIYKEEVFKHLAAKLVEESCKRRARWKQRETDFWDGIERY